MVTRIEETAVTSKNSVVRELRLEEVSSQYENQFKDILDDVLRFDIPVDYAIRLGFQYDLYPVYVSKKDHTLIISCHDMNLNPLESIILSSYIFKPKGFPKSTMLDVHIDSKYLCIPKHLCDEFNAGDDIVYEYVKETEDTERHLVVRHVS